ncbi:MAG: hypothetical protein M0Z45_05850 [Actinomycetota bacterium]|nr:hypothetical protein [Actinomycetota bacterium]
MEDLSKQSTVGRDSDLIIDLTEFDGPKLQAPSFPGIALPSSREKGGNLLTKTMLDEIAEPEVAPIHPKVKVARQTRTRRREFISLILALILFFVIGSVVFLASQASKSQLSVIASSGEQVVLNFQGTATVNSIAVHAGEYVRKGQILATQDAAVANAKIKADLANIVADKSAIATAQQQISKPTAAEQATISADNSAIAELQSELADTISSENQMIVTAQQQYNSLVQLEQNDASTYSNICPNGLSSQSTANGANTCSNLYDQIDSDARAASAAAADANSVEANAVIARDQVQSRLNQAINQLSQDQAQITTTESSTTALAQLNSKLNADQNLLNQDQQGLAQANLIAPISGIVEEVNGNVGEVAGPNGTTNFQQGSVATDQISSQSLFQSIGKTQTPTATSSVPLIVIDSRESWNVKLIVPQNQLGKYPPGKKVVTTFQVPDKTTFIGTVADMSPIPVDENGLSYFQITVNEKGPMPKGLYQGLVGTLS